MIFYYDYAEFYGAFTTLSRILQLCHVYVEIKHKPVSRPTVLGKVILLN